MTRRSRTRSDVVEPVPSNTTGRSYAQVATSPPRVPNSSVTTEVRDHSRASEANRKGGFLFGPSPQDEDEDEGADVHFKTKSSLTPSLRGNRTKQEDTDLEELIEAQRSAKGTPRGTVTVPQVVGGGLVSPFRGGGGLVHPGGPGNEEFDDPFTYVMHAIEKMSNEELKTLELRIRSTRLESEGSKAERKTERRRRREQLSHKKAGSDCTGSETDEDHEISSRREPYQDKRKGIDPGDFGILERNNPRQLSPDTKLAEYERPNSAYMHVKEQTRLKNRPSEPEYTKNRLNSTKEYKAEFSEDLSTGLSSNEDHRRSKKKRTHRREAKEKTKTRRRKEWTFPYALSKDDLRSRHNERGSDSSSSDDEFIEPSEPDSDDSRKTRRRKLKRRRAWKAKVMKAKILASIAEPMRPNQYDGVADEFVFYKFVIECEQYIDQTVLAFFPREQVGRLASFLTGKASLFFMQRIGMNARHWTTNEFFDGLVNYCFPTNCRERLYARFADCCQGDRSVQDFVDELLMLSAMLGDIPETEKVKRLWFGSRMEYRQSLITWSAHELKPETSTFEEVLRMLSIAERFTRPDQPAQSRPPQKNNKRIGQRSTAPRNRGLRHGKGYQGPN